MEQKGNQAKIHIEHVSFYYGAQQALTDITMDVRERQVTAFIGPSGCGKSTLLRCLNRMNDPIPHTRMEGRVLIDGQDIYKPATDVVELRRRVGLVFQKPNPFPQSVYANTALGPRALGMARGTELDELVAGSLQRVGLWDEIGGDLRTPALNLSLGQQQQLCIARTLAVQPEVILMDEPCSALDPVATLRIEDLIRELRRDYTIIIVTHNMQQAARVSDRTAFFWLGRMVEYDETARLFTRPSHDLTEAYVSGRVG